MPENPELEKLYSQSNVEEGLELKIDIATFQAKLKQALLADIDPSNDSRFEHWSVLSELEKLQEEQQKEIGQDPELQSLTQALILARFRESLNQKQYDNFSHILLSKKRFEKVVPVEKLVITSDEDVVGIKECIIAMTKRSHLNNLLNLAEIIQLPEQVLRDPEVASVLNGVHLGISYPRDLSVDRTAQYLNEYLPGDRKVPKLTKELKEFVGHYSGEEDQLKKISELVEKVENFDIEQSWEEIRAGLIKNFDYQYYQAEAIPKIAASFGFEDKIKNDPEVRELVKKKTLDKLKEYKFNTLEEITKLDNFFTLDSDFTSSENFQQAFENCFTQYLMREYSSDDRHIAEWQDAFKNFNISAEQVEAAVLEAIKRSAALTKNKDESYSQINKLAASDFITNKTKLLNKDIQETIRELIVSNTQSEWNYSSLTNLIASFPLSEEITQDPAVIKAAENHFRGVHSRAYTTLGHTIATRFKLDESVVRQQTMQTISRELHWNYKNAPKIKEVFGLEENDYISALATGIRNEVLSDNWKDYGEYTLIGNLKNISEITSPELFQQALIQAYQDALTSGADFTTISRLSTLLNNLKIAEDVFRLPKTQEAYRNAFIHYLSNSQVDTVYKMLDKESSFYVEKSTLEDKEVIDAAHQALLNFVKTKSFHFFDQLIRTFKLEPRVVHDSEAQAVIKEQVINYFKNFNANSSYFNIKELDNWLNKFPLPYDIAEDPEIQKTIQRSLLELCRKDRREFQSVILLHHEPGNYPQEKDFSIDKEKYSKAFRSLVDLFGYKTATDFFEHANRETAYINFILSDLNNETQLEQKDLEAVNMARLNLFEAEQAKRVGVDFPELKNGENYKRLFEALRAHSDEWKDVQNISGPFESGGDIFGYRQMFEYINRDGLSRHDALHAFNSIINLYEQSGLAPEKFYNNILTQVNRDSSTYESGTAHHELNSIASSLDTNYAATLERANEYSDIPMLQELVEAYKTPADIFQSWKSFRRFNELSKLLERTEILDELKELRAQGKDKLYTYIERLAFHPDSSVDMQAVIQFWRDPERFLNLSDDHTPEEVHNRKKPSNYTDIPYLDLRADELRDSLVEGKLDTLQAFRPLEIEYEIARNPNKLVPLVTAVKQALGSRKDNIKGTAKNAGKLFSELKRYFAAHNLALETYLQGGVESLPVGLEEQIGIALYNPNYGAPKPKVDTVKILAKINLKSDPNGVLAGNDTVCCMPFGSGKNNVYMFNPDTSLFTIQVQRPDGTTRTIAQSVLTKDKNIGKNLADVLAELQNTGEHLNNIVSENVLVESPNTLACDNIEIAPNYQTVEYEQVVEQIYRDFFREYLSRFSKEQNFNPANVVIGKGYTDALTHLPEVDNTFVPAAPVGYSDKTAATVYNLDMGIVPKGIVNRKIQVKELAGTREEVVPTVSGTALLTFEDTLPVAYLEGKAYADNQSLITYLHNIENGLIAKDINNTKKDRPNMSIKYSDSKGKMKGYILAYETSRQNAEYDDYNDYNSSTKELDGNFIYISDLATDKEGTIAGGRLVQAFVELYQKNYLDKDILTPIYAQAREQTSYRLLKRQLDRISQSTGITFELEELETYQVGADTIHPVIIRPRK